MFWLNIVWIEGELTRTVQEVQSALKSLAAGEPSEPEDPQGKS